MNRIFILILLSLTPAALAVSTSSWKHTSEADFQPGTMSNVVATNLGDLKLSRAVETLLEQDPEVSSVYAMVEAPDGTVFVGTGPNGTLMQISGGKVQ